MNNRAVLTVEAVRENLRVLLVSGEPHAGERTWRNMLKSDAAVDLAVGTRTGAVATDQYETAFTASGWDLGRWAGSNRTVDAGSNGSSMGGTWVEAGVRTDQPGN